MNIGQLKQAIEGLPDDTPLIGLTFHRDHKTTTPFTISAIDTDFEVGVVYVCVGEWFPYLEEVKSK